MVVGFTTFAEDDAWLAVAHVEEVTVAENMSPDASVRPDMVQAPELLAVVAQLAAVGLVLLRVIEAFGVLVPEIDVAVDNNLPFTSVLIIGGVL